MKYKPDQIQTHEIKDATLEVGKFSKKVVHVAAGAPAASNDTGEGYEQGSIWVDSTNGDMYVCTDHSAEDASWANMEGDDINPPFTLQGSTYGFYVGGDGPVRSDKVTRLTFAAPNDASDQAEMIGHRTNLFKGSCRNETHSFITGGYTYPGYGSNPGGRYDQIERMSLTAPYAGADVGEMTLARDLGSSLTDGTKALLVGGTGGSPAVRQDVIEQFTLGGSPITASDTSSELSGASRAHAGVSDSASAKGYIAGGTSPPGSTFDTIEGVPIGIAPGGSTSDYGELSSAWQGGGGSQSSTHGYIMGGYSPSATDNIEKYPFGTSGSVTDVGEMSQAMGNPAGCQGPSNIFILGGISNPGVTQNRIDKFSYPSDANASDVGNLVDALHYGYGTEV